MRRTAALLLTLLVVGAGCSGESGSGADTKPARTYKPNSNQNPNYSAP